MLAGECGTVPFWDEEGTLEDGLMGGQQELESGVVSLWHQLTVDWGEWRRREISPRWGCKK